MTKPKFTPWPWEVKPEEVGKSYIRIRGSRLGRRFKIANVIHPDHEGTTDSDAEETMANANLIAAAPELYEALVDMHRTQLNNNKHDPDDYENTEQCLRVKAALAKARGESHD